MDVREGTGEETWGALSMDCAESILSRGGTLHRGTEA